MIELSEHTKNNAKKYARAFMDKVAAHQLAKANGKMRGRSTTKNVEVHETCPKALDAEHSTTLETAEIEGLSTEMVAPATPIEYKSAGTDTESENGSSSSPVSDSQHDEDQSQRTTQEVLTTHVEVRMPSSQDHKRARPLDFAPPLDLPAEKRTHTVVLQT